MGIGDGLQFSSLPENYYKATGEYLVDISRPWFFDHNPYVSRETIVADTVTELWNFSPKQYDWPVIRPEGVYLSNAEIHASVFGVPVSLNRPRLYKHEVFAFERREKILLHVDGKSQGMMPDHIIKHVVNKYKKTSNLFIIGNAMVFEDYGLPRLFTPTLWHLAELISQARMLIGMDSGPSWIAACYPDVVVKKVRMKPTPETFKTWVPLAAANIHAHWDDRCHQVFNPTEDDIGFTGSYLKI